MHTLNFKAIFHLKADFDFPAAQLNVQTQYREFLILIN